MALPTFKRPPNSKEFFSKESEEEFDKLPPYARHFVQQFVKTGSMELAAKQAQIKAKSLKVSKYDSASECMDAHNLSVENIISKLSDCLEAKVLIKDKSGILQEGHDLKLRLQTAELLLRLHGELSQKKATAPKKETADLFESTDPNIKD